MTSERHSVHHAPRKDVMKLSIEFSPCSFSTSQDKSKTKRLPFNPQWRAQIPAKSYLGGPQATWQPPQPSPMSHSDWGFNEEAEAIAHPRHADHPPVAYSPPFSCFRLPLQGEREHSACLQPSLVFGIIPPSNSSFVLKKALHFCS